MNTYTDDGELVTKKDLRFLRDELKGDIKFIRQELQQDNARYYGLIRDEVRHEAQLTRELLQDLPGRASEFSEKFEENEDEHRNFRTRLGALEKV